MITNYDIKKMKAVFATKDDLKSFATQEYVDKRFDRLFLYLDNRFEPLEEMKKDFDKFKDKVFISLDWLVNAFKKFDDEHTVLSEQNKRTNGKLEDHEERIISLERRTVTA